MGGRWLISRERDGLPLTKAGTEAFGKREEASREREEGEGEFRAKAKRAKGKAKRKKEKKKSNKRH